MEDYKLQLKDKIHPVLNAAKANLGITTYDPYERETASYYRGMINALEWVLKEL